MSRIPTYRAWDKVNHMMIENILSINFYNRTITFFDKNLNTNVSMDFDDVILMPSTGLTIKHRKNPRQDVFEGDILKGKYYFRGVGWYDTGEGDYSVHGPIEYKDGKFVCCGFDIGDLVCGDRLKIIGNIYENPELIEKETH